MGGRRDSPDPGAITFEKATGTTVLRLVARMLRSKGAANTWGNTKACLKHDDFRLGIAGPGSEGRSRRRQAGPDDTVGTLKLHGGRLKVEPL